MVVFVFFFSSRRRHTRCGRDWSSDVCSSDLAEPRVRLRQIYRRPESRHDSGARGLTLRAPDYSTGVLLASWRLDACDCDMPTSAARHLGSKTMAITLIKKLVEPAVDLPWAFRTSCSVGRWRIPSLHKRPC